MRKVGGLVYRKSPLNRRRRCRRDVGGGYRVVNKSAVLRSDRGTVHLRGMKGSKTSATQGAALGITLSVVTQGRV
ncbi:hypothetical protein HBI56_190570 [Parastagonospora nodorum]|uniref:Uncharacterized protein n=1 Tax=Phaeosphaeria nodorum (strain SN15 / ATCC MYA-4574 / FGSC 10173) TaxID=321614 RepID=A0A7U2FEI7_PHANO|nr:hypothetical protein HBH56_143880 [Parastagonospora nodorum]QRD01451.1 hypothetical protein JI435_416690 [Parastagonospora nodorum SN15]KAH3927795.1 hypothetical protein HBH54_149070 [Parastagonospora nodorum]KAH3948066.1 hypothetical protein HBH53_109120 [Parastagonospora nodorum]KAH3961940.1 hypothetical protein HBH51_177720 [Parastagonospora nodorum]